ncbi:hypothetical protein AcV5_006241 [Taiwanofungus camphoratus]|nr:hypothetical protein AcW2_004677 [Antrodia cinnamomea]KAI0934385.1 hypothetical protein AcV5_006241 [Antrodia cinnamomea]KAI0950326.1 hypothetical protein AcV7_008832 [Antrodia cinnamomea]
MQLPKYRDLLYDTALTLWKTVVNIFFREVRPRGTFHIPRDGPVILVAGPHNNQLLDLLLALPVYRETGRRVQFLVAAKSMENRLIGFFARMMSSIPVVRASDNARPGIGYIVLSEDDPCLVIGHGTCFLSEFAPKMQIRLPKSIDSSAAEVMEVISDTELRIVREFASDSENGTFKFREKIAELKAEGKQGLEFKKVPFVDQREMYQNVHQCLTSGGCICVFPEGGSHDRTDLLPLKAGVSIMALGAMTNDPNVRVKIVPVGLSYFHAHCFRSRAVVEFGEAMDVPPNLVEKFKEGGAQRREAVNKLLDLVSDGLKTVTVRAPDYDTLILVQAARRLYKTPGRHPTLGQVVEINRRFLTAYHHFKDEPKVKELRADVLKYNRSIRDLGLCDHQVMGARKANWKTLGLLTYRSGVLLVWFILALPGLILNGPIFLVASVMSRKKASEALAASTVKVAGRDVLATWKILISLILAPILYGAYASFVTILVIKANAPLKWQITTPFMVIISLSFVGYAALKFGEAGMDVLKSLPPLIVALIPGQQHSLDRLKAMRIDVANELAEVICEFGPQVYEDMDGLYTSIPSASVPSGMHGIWRRKSGTRDIGAQGNLLVHPMSWLDERLFGWSASAGHETGTRPRSTRDEEPGNALTSYTSDDEAGDYDNVLRYVKGHSQMRGGSYADLHKSQDGSMLLNPSRQVVYSKIDGLHFRHRSQ